MKFLITGGAGFIGSNYCHYVTEKYPEDKFVCLDALTYAGNYNNIKELENKKNFKFVKGDIRDRELIYKLFEEVDRVDLKYIHANVDEHEGKIKRALKLMQDKGLIKKHGVTNGAWYVKK